MLESFQKYNIKHTFIDAIDGKPICDQIKPFLGDQIKPFLGIIHVDYGFNFKGKTQDLQNYIFEGKTQGISYKIDIRDCPDPYLKGSFDPKTGSSSLGYAQACSFSHIKAIYTAYNNKDKYAIIMEDDISFQYMPKWDHNISDIINIAPPNWKCLKLR